MKRVDRAWCLIGALLLYVVYGTVMEAKRVLNETRALVDRRVIGYGMVIARRR